MESLTSLTTTQTATYATAASTSNLSLEDEMLLFRLMSLKDNAAQRLANFPINSLPNDVTNAHRDLRTIAKPGIAPLPSLGSTRSNDNLAGNNVAEEASNVTVPLPSIANEASGR